MHLSMCLLVRNEEEIIEDNLAFHARMGVDRFLVMDHMSIDSTVRIIEKVKSRLNLDLTVYHQTNPAYMQAEWMTYLSREAHLRGTDWIVLCDADEFWLPNNGDLKATLATVPTEIDVVRGLWHNNVPLKDVSPYYNNIFFAAHPFLPKIIVRSRPDIGIRMGNHEASHVRNWLCKDSLRVMHYQNRPDNSLANKYLLGGKALAVSNLPEHYGIHWRQGRQAFEQGQFAEFAEKLFYTREEALNVKGVYQDETVRRIVLANRRKSV